MVDIAPTVAEIIQESPRPGGCRKVEDKDASSEQGVSVRVSQVRTLKAGSSFQKSHPCDPLSKDIFHLTGQQGTCPEQQPYPRKSRGRTFWVTENLVQSRRQQNGETLSRTEKGQASSVKSGQSHMSKKACTRQEDAEDLASSGLVPHRAAHNGGIPQGLANCGVIMAEAGPQNDANQHVVTFEDVCVYFSPEEWELLDVAQKRLYYAVMRETFELVASQGLAVSRYHLIPRAEPPRVHQAPGMVDIAPTVAEIIQESPRPGGCRKVEDKDASSEQGVSVRVSQVRTLKAGSSFQKSHPCDPLSKDIFHLTGQQGTCPEQQPYPRKSRGRTFWVTENLVQSRRQQNGETLSRTEKGQTSSVKSGQSHMSKKACTRQEDPEDLASSGLVPHRAAHNGRNPRAEKRYVAVLIGSWDPASVWVDVVIIVLQFLLPLKQQMDDPTKIWEVGDG
ncbi:hypothetical protein MUG91_G2158n1 [Manis pentadactyla]|nr:hypothetical protein MUG91_G2158n1 [Manis pentadactyla]